MNHDLKVAAGKNSFKVKNTELREILTGGKGKGTRGKVKLSLPASGRRI
jgi:hypothetical protein